MKMGKRVIVIAVLALLVVAGVGTYGVWNENRVTSIVQMDVNPSIELQVNRDGDVVRAVALNADAEKILEGMKLKGADADTAVNAIVGSLLRHGYVDEVANSILLTVEDENTERGARLKQELTEEINEILSGAAINAAILSQNMEESAIPGAEGISQGKATLIQNIVDANETYDAQELAKLSVNELNLIISNSKNNVSDVTSTGNATDSAYIGKDAAKAAAFSNAGVKEADVRDLEVEMDFEYSTMVYEVDFASGQYEYDYVIDAKSGEVLHSHREYDDDYVAATAKNDATSSTGTTAGTSTDKNSGTTSSTATNKNSETTSSTATNKNSGTTSTAAASKETTTTQESADIGKEKAKAIALAHAGFAESEVTRLKVERDRDDGRIEYSVEFTANGKEYDYEISASDGKILDYDVEVEDFD